MVDITMQPGKLIVIEGIDGSGKTTQWKLLGEVLESRGKSVQYMDFPQYPKLSAALVHNYLRGLYGKPDDVSPYAASLFYAIDRYDLTFQVRAWLERGNIVLANRYVASNGGHQGGKIADSEARAAYLDWLYDIEYNKLGIVRPDITLFLKVPLEITKQLLKYRGLPPDEHEKSLEHMEHAYESYQTMIQKYPEEFAVIECTAYGAIISKQEIHQRIIEILEKRNII